VTDAVSFLTTMAAMSASVQTLVEHLVKKNVKWLDEQNDNEAADRRRHVAIHGIVFAIAAGLAWSVDLTPLVYLGVQASTASNALATGILVSFGGSFFDEALGAIREFKKAQERVKGGQKG
jgi:hypothetical protein